VNLTAQFQRELGQFAMMAHPVLQQDQELVQVMVEWIIGFVNDK
jgi:hypothetical protein